METVFPNSKRSYLGLKEGRFCSGDLFFGRTQSVIHKRTLVRQMAERRAIAELLQVVQRALELEGKGIIVPFAQVGMDVDKPIQLEQVLAYLEK